LANDAKIFAKKQTRMLINLSVNIQNWTTDQTLSSLLFAHIRKHWLFFSANNAIVSVDEKKHGHSDLKTTY